MSGCDYLDSPSGIAIKTAYKLLEKFNNIETVVDNVNNLEENYLDKFYCAFLAFKFSRVFCPIKKKIVHLNDMDLEKIENEARMDFLAV